MLRPQFSLRRMFLAVTLACVGLYFFIAPMGTNLVWFGVGALFLGASAGILFRRPTP